MHELRIPMAMAGNGKGNVRPGQVLNPLLAGGVNVAHEVPRPYCKYSAEKVVSSDPDCVIMAYMEKESPVDLIKKRIGWSGISAVKNERVYNEIDPDLLLRPGPRLTEGLKALHGRFYPAK